METFHGTTILSVRRRNADGESLDFYRDFASPLPVIVIAEMLGVPALLLLLPVLGLALVLSVAGWRRVVMARA